MLVASASAGRLGPDPNAGPGAGGPLRGPPGAPREVAQEALAHPPVGLEGPGQGAGAGKGGENGAPVCAVTVPGQRPCPCAPPGAPAPAAEALEGVGPANTGHVAAGGRPPARAGPLRLKSINHVSRACSSVPASTAFYRDVLGFLEVKRPPSFDFEGSWLFGYGIGVHLIHGQPVRRAAEIDPRADHLSFQCNSMADVEDRLKHWGIKYVKEIILEGPAKVQQLFFHDPDNNMIEICNCECLLAVAGFEV